MSSKVKCPFSQLRHWKQHTKEMVTMEKVWCPTISIFLPKKSDIKTDSVDSVDSDVKSISKILDGLVCRGLSGRMRLFLAWEDWRHYIHTSKEEVFCLYVPTAKGNAYEHALSVSLVLMRNCSSYTVYTLLKLTT